MLSVTPVLKASTFQPCFGSSLAWLLPCQGQLPVSSTSSVKLRKVRTSTNQRQHADRFERQVNSHGPE